MQQNLFVFGFRLLDAAESNCSCRRLTSFVVKSEAYDGKYPLSALKYLGEGFPTTNDR